MALAGPIYRGIIVNLTPEQVEMRRAERWVDLANSIVKDITRKGASHGWHDGGVPSALGMYWSRSEAIARKFTANPEPEDMMGVVVAARYDATAAPGKQTGFGWAGDDEQEQTLSPGTRVEIDSLSLRISPYTTSWAKVSMNGLRAEASYDNSLIARGLKVYVGIDAHPEWVPDLLAGRATAQQVLSLLDEQRAGVWWGVMGDFGDLVDFEDYAWGDGLLADTYDDLDGGDVSIVLVGKRPTRDGVPWDPEIHNEPEAGGLMGNSYLQDHEQVDLVEVRYNAGNGWKSLPARGLRVTAAKTAGFADLSAEDQTKRVYAVEAALMSRLFSFPHLSEEEANALAAKIGPSIDVMYLPGSPTGKTLFTSGKPFQIMLGDRYQNEIGVIHEMAHVRVGHRGGGHDEVWLKEYARLLRKHCSQPEFVKMLNGNLVGRYASLRRAEAALGSRLWWRVHPEHRGDLMPEMATSAPFFDGNKPYTGPKSQGYSCFDNPWHLWLYVWLMWNWDGMKTSNTPVIGFTGTRVGTGHDGEDLVVPAENGTVLTYTVREFFDELMRTPFPPSPVFAPWAKQWNGAPSWLGLAHRLAWLDQGDPVHEHIVRTFLPQRKAAGVGQTTALPSWRDRGVLPSVDCVIAPDLGRSSRNSYLVYLYDEPHARRPTLAEAKATVEEIYGPLDWQRIEGDSDEHHDRVWGWTVWFNDAPHYYVVTRLPRLGGGVAGSVLGESGQARASRVLAMDQYNGQERIPAHPGARQEEQGAGRPSGVPIAGGAAGGIRGSQAHLRHTDLRQSQALAEGHVEGQRAGQAGSWQASQPSDPRRGELSGQTHRQAGAGDPQTTFGGGVAEGAGGRVRGQHGADLEDRSPRGVEASLSGLTFEHRGLGRYPDTVVALVDGQHVGSLQWIAGTPSDPQRVPGEVIDIRVDPGWQRKGIATAMWEYAQSLPFPPVHSPNLTGDGRAWSQTVGSRTASTHTIYRGLRVPFTDEIKACFTEYEEREETVERRSYKVGPLLLDMLEKHTGRHSTGVGIHWSTRPEMAGVAAETSGQFRDFPVILEATYTEADVVPEGDALYDLSAVWVGNKTEAEVLIKPGARLNITGVWITRGSWNSQVTSVDKCPRMKVRGDEYANVLDRPQRRTASARTAAATMDPREIYSRTDRIREHVTNITLPQAHDLLRKVLTDARFPQGADAYAEVSPLRSASAIGWDLDTTPPIPIVYLHPRSMTSLVLLHEAAHLLWLGGYKGRNHGFSTEQVHDRRWFEIWTNLVHRYGDWSTRYEFDRTFGLVDDPEWEKNAPLVMRASTAPQGCSQVDSEHGPEGSIARTGGRDVDRGDARRPHVGPDHLGRDHHPRRDRGRTEGEGPRPGRVRPPVRVGARKRPTVNQVDIGGPLALAFNGYSTERQREIFGALKAFREGRVRPDAKDPSRELRGCYTIPVGGLTTTEPDRLVLVKTVDGKWLAVYAVVNHNYGPASQHVPAWLASKHAKHVRLGSRTAASWSPFRPPAGIKILTGGDAVPGGYNGYFVAYDETSGEKMGYLDYQSAGDDVKIAMVEVEPAHRRKGVATVLLAALRNDFPDARIDPGYTTPDGNAWWAKVGSAPGLVSARRMPDNGLVTESAIQSPVWQGQGIYEMDISRWSTTRCVAFLVEFGGMGVFPLGWLTWDTERHTIEGIFVNEQYRGKGIGVEMKKAAEKAAGRSLDTDSGEYTPEGLAWAKKRGIPAKNTHPVSVSDMARMQARMNNLLAGSDDLIKALLIKAG